MRISSILVFRKEFSSFHSSQPEIFAKNGGQIQSETSKIVLVRPTLSLKRSDQRRKSDNFCSYKAFPHLSSFTLLHSIRRRIYHFKSSKTNCGYVFSVHKRFPRTCYESTLRCMISTHGPSRNCELQARNSRHCLLNPPALALAMARNSSKTSM